MYNKTSIGEKNMKKPIFYWYAEISLFWRISKSRTSRTELPAHVEAVEAVNTFVSTAFDLSRNDIALDAGVLVK